MSANRRPVSVEAADPLGLDDRYDLLASEIDRSYEGTAAYSTQPVLTRTERAIVEHLARGHCSKEIATHMNRSRATVEFHVRSLFVKLNARSRAHIVARAFDAGILPTQRSIDGNA